MFKGNDTIGNYYISKKPYLITSNGHLVIVQNIVRTGYLWGGILFEKEVIFHKFDFETSHLELEVLKSSI